MGLTNWGVAIASLAVAAGIVYKEKQLVAHFQAARATNTSSAMSLAALGVERGLVWKRLVRRAVIRQGAPDTFFLDEPSWVALRRTRQRIATLIVILALIALAFAFRAA